jgi:predicted helicase
MQGMWPKYVENDLIPRLNGFELLMTSYAMAHLKMDILLTETGFTNPNNKRFKIFLTNSLEEAHENQFNLFTQWLSQEANEANAIKKDTPVMCVIGNPPYSVSSNNKSPWIEKLTADYKNDLNERNIQPLSDDYIKFIRFGQHFIDTNGEGLLAYISNNSFIDGIIHRQMRKNLLETFDKIFILDLHGNSKKQEVCKDGSPDQNVFDIMQGVSINIFVKSQKKNKNELGKVFHFDLQGKRNDKYSFLNDNNLNSISWDNILFKAPEFLFSKMDFELKTKYDFGFSLNKLFPLNNVGFTAARDNSLIHFEKGKVEELLTDLTSMELENIRIKHQFGPDSRDWTLQGAINDIKAKTERNISILNYRPFDFRYSHLSNQTKGFFSYPRWEIMRNFYKKENIGLIATRLNRQKSTGYFWISKSIIERHILDTAGDSTSFFPLYIYPEFNGQQTTDQTIVRVPNLNMEFVSKISKSLELTFTNEKEDNSKSFAPLDLLDYIYAVLHSPSYREKYKEFLKIDFPRVPYATDAAKFWKLVVLGKELREIHLLESPKVEEFLTGYPEEGDNIVGKPTYKDGSVYINETQYFSNVKQVAWNFYIGGYQPAQKWLKDRKGRELSFDDILHYQKIIVALTETDRIMKEIDEVGVE